MAAESRLQKKIRLDLEKQGWMVVKIMLCNSPGFPDVMALRMNQVLFLEIKAKGKEPKPLQEYRHKELKKMRFNVFAINTWEKYLTLRQRL